MAKETTAWMRFYDATFEWFADSGPFCSCIFSSWLFPAGIKRLFEACHGSQLFLWQLRVLEISCCHIVKGRWKAYAKGDPTVKK